MTVLKLSSWRFLKQIRQYKRPAHRQRWKQTNLLFSNRWLWGRSQHFVYVAFHSSIPPVRYNTGFGEQGSHPPCKSFLGLQWWKLSCFLNLFGTDGSVGVIGLFPSPFRLDRLFFDQFHFSPMEKKHSPITLVDKSFFFSIFVSRTGLSGVVLDVKGEAYTASTRRNYRFAVSTIKTPAMPATLETDETAFLIGTNRKNRIDPTVEGRIG